MAVCSLATQKQPGGPRVGPAVCAAGGMLVAIGGRDPEGRILATGDVWDPSLKKGSWTTLPESLTSHCFAVAVAATVP